MKLIADLLDQSGHPGTWALARVTTSESLAASGTGLEAALAITVLSAGVMVGAEYGVWWVRNKNMWKKVNAVTAKLLMRVPSQPLAPLLNEYYSAVERLGYFYSYNLLLVESGRAGMAEG